MQLNLVLSAVFTVKTAMLDLSLENSYINLKTVSSSFNILRHWAHFLLELYLKTHHFFNDVFPSFRR